jgi:hypothetical protein
MEKLIFVFERLTDEYSTRAFNKYMKNINDAGVRLFRVLVHSQTIYLLRFIASNGSLIG